MIRRAVLMLTLEHLDWRGYYWPERFPYVFTPYFMFLLIMIHIFDSVYPIFFAQIRDKELLGKQGDQARKRMQ